MENRSTSSSWRTSGTGGPKKTRTAELRQGRDKTEKVKKARKSKKHKKKEKKAGKKKHKKKEKKAGKKQDKKNKKPAEDSQAGDSGDSQQPADVRHDPSPQEAMGEDREIQEAAETQHQLAVSSPPDEVDWGDEDDDADSHHTAAADLGGSDSDTEAAPTAALGTPADLNWPWGERGRPSDRASSSGGGTLRPRTPSRSPRRENVVLQPGPMWQAVQQVQRHMKRSRGSS